MENELFYREQLHIDGNLLSVITDTVPVGIVMVDTNGLIRFANPKAEQLLGLTRDVITHSLYNAPAFHISGIDGEPFPEDELPFRRVKKSLLPVFDIEHAIEHPDGARILLSINAAPLFNAEKRFIGVVSSLEDITERIRAEETLKESLRESQFLADLLEHSSQPFVSGLLDGKLIKFNSAYSQLIGYTEEETAALDWRTELTPPEWRDIESEHLAELRRTGKPMRYEKEYFRKDGSRVPIELLVHLAKDDDGAPKFYYSFITDISERKRSEEIIRHKDELLQMTGEIAKVGGWEFDPLTLEGTWTDEVAKIHDVPPGQETNATFGLSFYEGESKSKIEKAVHEAITMAKPYDLELELVTATGAHKWVKTQGFPVLDGGTVVQVRGIFQDITERKFAEEERKKLEMQLFQAQKIESIGILAAGVAHDFNNILNIIMGNADLLSQKPVESDKMKKRIDAIMTATDRGAQLVKQLLTFARKTEFEQRTVVINDVILETAKLFEETFPKTIEITLRLTPHLPGIIGDANQLYQIILNLCINARDAMPKGGTLIIATETVRGDAVRAKFHASSAPTYGLIRIRDTGTGMDQETLGHIFDPFYTTKEKGKGTGLGLPVVSGIIDTHNGFLDVESSVGVGTEFRIYLPGVDQLGESKEEIEAHLDAAAGGSETILYVEDEPLGRDMVVEYLEKKGYRVITAVNGEEAVDLFAAHADEIALVLTDFGLPVFDGEEVSRRIKRIRGNTPIIMISGFIPPERRTMLMRIGVQEVLPKPYKMADLFVAIRHTLDATKHRRR